MSLIQSMGALNESLAHSEDELSKAREEKAITVAGELVEQVARLEVFHAQVQALVRFAALALALAAASREAAERAAREEQAAGCRRAMPGMASSRHGGTTLRA